MVPLLVMGFKVPIEIAIGVTALALFPSSLLSTYLNVRRKTVDFKLMWALELPTIAGAILGAHCTSVLPARPLEIIFSFFLILLSYKIMKPSDAHHLLGQALSFLNSKKPIIKRQDYKVSLWAAGLFGALSGMVAGLFGIGGGVVKTPVMISIFKVPVKIATSTALCMIVFTSFTSGLTHYTLGHVTPDLLISCGGGFLVGALVGGEVGLKMMEYSLKKIIAVSIFMAGMAVLIHAIWLN